ncbi:MAG: rod shape-determining protein MreD [Eubacteriales bacterium]|nr:rod shape-determining protein MreD [Eubacteriales bacterium]
MKILKIFLTAVALFVLERVLFVRQFEIFSLTPWLLFTFSLTVASVSEEYNDALATAFFCGLAADISGGGEFGSATAVFTLSAAAVYFFSSRLFRNSLIIALVGVFVFGLGGEMIYFFLNGRGISDFSALQTLWSVALPLAVIDTVFALVLYPLAKRLFAGRRYV